MRIDPEEIDETLMMVTQQNLDIRAVTLGLSLAGCVMPTSTSWPRRSTSA